MILAALQTVPTELSEAARVDGASRWQIFRAVTLPYITPTLMLLVVLASIYRLQAIHHHLADDGRRSGRGDRDDRDSGLPDRVPLL